MSQGLHGPGRISVVIPVWNEAARIEQRLTELQRFDDIEEIIVVDGGSHDATCRLVEASGARQTPVQLLHGPRGRARQQNLGARSARGSVLWFVHADVSPPANAIEWIHTALADERVVAGAFRTWTVPDADPSHRAPWLHLADIRSRYSGLPYGDQAIFVRRSAFERVGGFPDILLMEDLELSLRLRRLGRIRIAPVSVRVSGRRFLAHPLRDTALVNVFPLLYRLGVPPGALARVYANTR